MPHDPASDAIAMSGRQSQDVALVDEHLTAVHDHLVRLGRSGPDARDWTVAAFADRPADLVGALRAAHARARPVLAARGRRGRVDDVAARHALARVDADRLAVDGPPAADAADAAPTVWEATTALDHATFAMLDLHLRQGLTSAQVADVLGLDAGGAFVLLGRARERADAVITAHQLLRRATRRCADLEAAVLAGPADADHLELLAVVDQHAEGCDACTALRGDVPPALDVFAALAPVAVPPGLREEVLLHLASPPTASRPRRRWGLVAVVVAAVVAMVVGGLLVEDRATTVGERDALGSRPPAPTTPATDAPGPSGPSGPLARTEPSASTSVDGGLPASDPDGQQQPAEDGGRPARPAVEVTRPKGPATLRAVHEDSLGPYAVIDLTAHDRGDRDDELSWRWSSDAQDGTLLNEASGSTRLYTRPCTTTEHVITVSAFDDAGNGGQDLIRVVVAHEC